MSYFHAGEELEKKKSKIKPGKNIPEWLNDGKIKE